MLHEAQDVGNFGDPVRSGNASTKRSHSGRPGGWEWDRAPEALRSTRAGAGAWRQEWRAADGAGRRRRRLPRGGPRLPVCRGPGRRGGGWAGAERLAVRGKAEGGAVLESNVRAGPAMWTGSPGRASRGFRAAPRGRRGAQHPHPLLSAPARIRSVRAPASRRVGKKGEGRSLYLALTRRVPGPRLRFPLRALLPSLPRHPLLRRLVPSVP